MAAAQVTIDRQPDECRQMWGDLRPRPGEGPQSVLRRYVEHLRGPVNARIARCYAFNENQRLGLTKGVTP